MSEKLMATPAVGTEKAVKIYLAGKISKGDWRTGLVQQPSSVQKWRKTDDLPMGTNICTGPFFVACDHGCSHRPESQHGVTYSCTGETVTEQEVIDKALRGVRAADLVFCFADKNFMTAHGTHCELAAAKALGKSIVIVRNPMLDPTLPWFPLGLADITLYGEDPGAELAKFLSCVRKLATSATASATTVVLEGGR